MERFTKTNDGWWRDSVTGLEWSPTALDVMAHAEATAWCECAGGRLPTIDELLTLVDYAKSVPCTDVPDTQSDSYWSASTYAPNPVDAWGVDFGDGDVYYFIKTNDYYVRAVRRGS